MVRRHYMPSTPPENGTIRLVLLGLLILHFLLGTGENLLIQQVGLQLLGLGVAHCTSERLLLL